MCAAFAEALAWINQLVAEAGAAPQQLIVAVRRVLSTYNTGKNVTAEQQQHNPLQSLDR